MKIIKLKSFSWLIFLVLMTLFSASELLAQEKLSRRERKAKAKETMASRLFIEGQKNLLIEDYEKAYFYFKKALDFNDEEPAIYFKLAEMMVKANELEKALEFGEQAIALDPENKYYHLQIAEIYSKQNKNLEAAEVLQNLMDKEGNHQQYILELASLYLTTQSFDKALEALEKAEEYFGVVEQLTAQKQKIYLRKNDLPNAILEGEKLIAAHPGNSQYVLALVEILFNNKKVNQALDLVLNSLKTYPNQPDLKMAAYTLYKEKGHFELSNSYILEAFKNPDLEPDVKARGFSEVMGQMKSESRDSLLHELSETMDRLHPNNQEVLNILGDWEMQQKREIKAMEYYVQSIGVQPKNEKVLYRLIPLMFDLKHPFEKIVKVTEVAVEEFPEKAVFWFYHGTAKLGDKAYKEAKTALEKAIKLNGETNKQLEMMAYAQLGDALHSLEHKEDAYDAYEKVLSQNANNEHILNNYAYFLSLDKKDLEKALQMSEKLVNRFPENATYLDTHAWVLFQMEKYEDAKFYMEKALKYQDPPSGVMLEHYGDILYKLGEQQIALKYWNKAKELEDTSEFLTLKIKNKKYYD